MKVRACLRSGLCCKSAPCPFGFWDADRHQCIYLIVEKVEQGCPRYTCLQYNYIRSLPTEAMADLSPAFGAGCCMTLYNEYRDAIRDKVYNGVEQFVQIEMRKHG